MATGLDLTKVYAGTLDVKRKLHRGTDETLKLIRLKPGTAAAGGGYKLLKTISAGWNAKRVTKKGNQVFEVTIADVDGSLRTLMELGPEVPSHVLIEKSGVGIAYKKDATDQPEKASQVWVIKCSPTGERVAVT